MAKQYIFDATDEQEAAVQYAMGLLNAERARESLPPVTDDEYFQARSLGVVSDYIRQMREAEAAKVAEAYVTSADDAARATVKRALGVDA